MSSRLAKAVVTGEAELIDIALYYEFRNNVFGVPKIVDLNDEEAKEALEDPKRKENVEVLNTRWKMASWQEQNDIVSKSQVVDEFSGNKEPNWAHYRDMRVKRLLKEWDLEFDGKIVPVTEEYINNLPAEIVLGLFDRFERISGVDKDAEGK